mgnify:CR=1 FL=1
MKTNQENQMKVLKFGGTSVGSAKNIQKVIEIVKNESLSENVSVVVSAIGGITDRLLAAADKYDLYRLKCICENLLFERMTCEDCADVLVAADMHNASALKSRCLSFMTESAGRVREVMDSDAFKHLSDTRPQLLVAIMQAMSDESIIMTPSKKRFLELTDHFGATSNKRQRR